MRPSLIPGRTTNYPIAIATCAWLGAISVAQASAPALLQEPGSKNSFPEYRTGDVATRDIIAPFEIAVVNAERTERLRQQELDKLPAIYRFDPWVTLRTEENFSQAFSRTRAAFLENMEIAALLPLGFPRGKFGKTTRKPVDEVLYWDRWESKKV